MNIVHVVLFFILTSRLLENPKVVFQTWLLGMLGQWTFLVYQVCSDPQKRRFDGVVFNGSQLGPVVTVSSLLGWLPVWATLFVLFEFFYHGQISFILASKVALLVFVAALLFGSIAGVSVGVFVEIREALLSRKKKRK